MAIKTKKSSKPTSGKPSSKLSKMERMKARKKTLSEKGGGGKGGFFFVSKPGKYRMRSVPVQEDFENGLEVIQYYLGPEIKGVISPASIGLPCALEEHYQSLRESDDEDDKDIAAKMSRRIRYVMPHYRYKDLDGKEVDEEAGVKLLLMTGGMYNDWVDFYLEKEIGDPSDPINGFDIKYGREGSGKMDTEYTLLQCKNTRCHKKFATPVNPEELLKKSLPSYEETEEYLKKFLGTTEDEEEDERDDLQDNPRPKKKVGLKRSSEKASKKVFKKR